MNEVVLLHKILFYRYFILSFRRLALFHNSWVLRSTSGHIWVNLKIGELFFVVVYFCIVICSISKIKIHNSVSITSQRRVKCVKFAITRSSLCIRHIHNQLAVLTSFLCHLMFKLYTKSMVIKIYNTFTWNAHEIVKRKKLFFDVNNWKSVITVSEKGP